MEIALTAAMRQNIFTPLYNNQIPPGAAAVVHYQFTVPEDQQKPIEIEIKLNYRKFDSTYMEYVYGKDYRNELPVSVLAEDRLSFGIEGSSQPQSERTLAIQPEDFPMWQRWNDYGIGLLLKGNAGSDKGELKQAAAAFSEVEALGRRKGHQPRSSLFQGGKSG